MKSFKKAKLFTLALSLTTGTYLFQKYNLDFSKSKIFSSTSRDLIEESRTQLTNELIFEKFSNELEGGNDFLLDTLYTKYSKNLTAVNEEYRKKLNKAREVEIGELEEIIEVGDASKFPYKSFALIDIFKIRSQYDKIIEEKTDEGKFIKSKINNNKNKKEDIQTNIVINEFDTEKFFGKILFFRSGNDFYATGSYCGYCLRNLVDGVFLGTKLTCNHCLSEYNVTDGSAERGPNNKYLAIFPVINSKGKLFISLPKTQIIPQFKKPQEGEKASLIDPRHIILIGANETTWGALNVLNKCFPGKITILTNKDSDFFIDFNKLHSSFFPLNPNKISYIGENELRERKISVIDEKIHSITLENRQVKLFNDMKLPYDKVLIAPGLQRSTIGSKLTNCTSINNIIEHSVAYKLLNDSNNKNLVVVGDSAEAMKIACSARRYKDYNKQDEFPIALVSPSTWFLEILCNKEAVALVDNYLKRNGIALFKGMGVIFNENSNTNKLNKIVLYSNKSKNIINIPVSALFIEDGATITKCDFVNNIIDQKVVGHRVINKSEKGLLYPDIRYSIQSSTRYPHLLAAGSCSLINNTKVPGYVNSENPKTNYDIGLLAGLALLDFYKPYDYVPVEVTHVLDKKLTFIGNSKKSYENHIVHLDKQNNRFISYLILGNEVKGAVTFGFNKFDIYLKEALENGLMPSVEYIKSHADTAHTFIAETVIKNSDSIQCVMERAFTYCNNTSLSEFDQADQKYMADLGERFDEAEKKVIALAEKKHQKLMEETNNLDYEERAMKIKSELEGSKKI